MSAKRRETAEEDPFEERMSEKQKVRELKRYTRELIKDHDALAQKFAAAQLEVARLQAEAEAVEERAAVSEADKITSKPASTGSSSYLFGELIRVRERAQHAEVEAARLKVMLAMAHELRAVDVARTRAAISRALTAAIANLKQHAEGGFRHEKPRLTDLDLVAVEREAMTVAVETAADEARRTWRRRKKLLGNSDGVSRRLVRALEAVLLHCAHSYDAFLLEAAAATAVAAEWRRRLPEDQPAHRKRLEECVLLCVAKATEVSIPGWLECVGWGRGRLALVELLNRCAAAFAIEALCLEMTHTNEKRSAGPVVAHYAHGALLLDIARVGRVVAALDKLEAVAKFALAHACKRCAALAELDERVLVRRAKTPPHKLSADDACLSVPSPPALAALRRRGVKSAIGVALEGQAWRKARVEPRRSLGSLWEKSSSVGYAERPVRLRDGCDDHVVCWQWQSRSDRLRWSLSFDNASPDRPELEAPEQVDERTNDEEDDTDVGSDAPEDDDNRGSLSMSRWGGALAQPEDLEDLDDIDNDDDIGSAPTANVTPPRDNIHGKLLPTIESVPDNVLASECVIGAEKELGPVRETWAIVPAHARVSLRCDLVASRPLVRARTARFRVVAIRASTFFQSCLVQAAVSAEDALWSVANETRAPPSDAADFAARCQLEPQAKRRYGDLQRILQRSALLQSPRLPSVFGHDHARAEGGQEVGNFLRIPSLSVPLSSMFRREDNIARPRAKHKQPHQDAARARHNVILFVY